MLKSKLKRTSLALVLTVVLMLSLFMVPAYALEDAGVADLDKDGILLDANSPSTTVEAESTASGEDVATQPTEDAETTAATNSETTPETAPDTTVPSGNTDTNETTTGEDTHDHDTDKETEKKGMSTSSIISLAVLGFVIILVVVYCVTHKEKVSKMLRGLKSELKKIVWTPWNQVRKNTLVVLIVIISAAILIGLLDLIFSHGIVELRNIF